MPNEWYRKSTKETATKLSVDIKQGLSTKEAKTRLEKVGPNVIESTKKINPFQLFVSQFKDVLIIILIAAALVSFGVTYYENDIHANGSNEISTTCPAKEPINEACREHVPEESDSANEGYIEAGLIFAIVIAIAIIGFLNEYKAEKTVEALKKLVGQNAKVRRDGSDLEIEAKDLVPGDVVLIEEGQKVQADIRLVQTRSLKVNEASLTGESVPVNKDTFEISKKSTLGDQKNMIFSGTIIASGTGEGVVVSTASETEIGKIATLVESVEEEQTPMQKKLDDLGKKLGIIILLICLVVFVAIFFIDKDNMGASSLDRIVFAFTVAIALAVAAIPEGLSFVVRISLALGARRMADKKALVRKLSAVEALGSTDVICSDKTGTLTRGEMAVREIRVPGGLYEVSGTGYSFEGDFKFHGKKEDKKALDRILQIGVLCNNAKINNGSVLGDPTEGSLIVSGAKANFHQEALSSKLERVDEVPFTSERKLMSTVHRSDKGYLVATKGAADILPGICTHILVNGKVRKITAKDKEEINKENLRMAKAALRVLAFAYKEERAKPSGEKNIENGLTYVGLQAMMDPPRDEVKEVMHRVTSEAGMRVIMITGDHIETAKAVAAEIGIEGEAMTGIELDKLTQKEFEEDVETISVYARVNPEHKIRIVDALKKHGHQVAMTGDGVNDAPAIKSADIGIAMGITGTDASKEASDLILLDDQFLTIINAIEEGRGIFDNVRKFVSYLLGANAAEVILVFLGILIFQDPILTATQLLFINIVTDGLPAVALGSDPAEERIMRFKPHHFQEAIINKYVWIELTVFGLVASALLLVQYGWSEGNSTSMIATSAVFVGIVIYELVRLVVLRTNYNIPWLSNPWLTVAIIGSMIVHLSVLYIPWMSDLFKVEALGAGNWIFIAIGSLVIFIIMKVTRAVLQKLIPEVGPTRNAPATHNT